MVISHTDQRVGRRLALAVDRHFGYSRIFRGYDAISDLADPEIVEAEEPL